MKVFFWRIPLRKITPKLEKLPRLVLNPMHITLIHETRCFWRMPGCPRNFPPFCWEFQGGVYWNVHDGLISATKCHLKDNYALQSTWDWLALGVFPPNKEFPTTNMLIFPYVFPSKIQPFQKQECKQTLHSLTGSPRKVAHVHCCGVNVQPQKEIETPLDLWGPSKWPEKYMWMFPKIGVPWGTPKWMVYTGKSY